MTAAQAPAGDRQWHIVGRWQEYEGEALANVLRLVAIGAFYVVELLQYHGFESASGPLLPFHRQATTIAVVWTMVALAIMLCLRLRVLPAALKYVATACDVLLLTLLAALGNGPFSALIGVYFLIVAVSALRFNLRLVWFATATCMLGYWSLVGLEDLKTSRWFDSQHAVPPVNQVLTLLSLGLTGVVIGQVVRRVKGMAIEYSQRLSAEERAT